MSDEKLEKYRRGLIIISVSLIVFILSGGEIEKISATAGTIKLHRPWVADIFAWLIFSYFLWSSRSLFIGNQVRDEFLDSLVHDPGFLSFIRKTIEFDKPQTDPRIASQLQHLMIHEVIKDSYKRSFFRRELRAHKITLPYTFIIQLEISTILKNIYAKDAFRERLFPLIIAITALILGVLKYCFRVL